MRSHYAYLILHFLVFTSRRAEYCLFGNTSKLNLNKFLVSAELTLCKHHTATLITCDYQEIYYLFNKVLTVIHKNTLRQIMKITKLLEETQRKRQRRNLTEVRCLP